MKYPNDSNRRRFFKLAAYGASAASLFVLAGCAQRPTGDGTSKIRVTSPVQGAQVGKVLITAEVDNWQLVNANQAPKAGEGHLHFFVDVPASSVADGQVIPTDKPESYVHAGKAPFGSREIALKPGTHTVVVVMGDSEHKKLASPEPVSITFLVN
jgi:hypothetical protein